MILQVMAVGLWLQMAVYLLWLLLVSLVRWGVNLLMLLLHVVCPPQVAKGIGYLAQMVVFSRLVTLHLMGLMASWQKNIELVIVRSLGHSFVEKKKTPAHGDILWSH